MQYVPVLGGVEGQVVPVCEPVVSDALGRRLSVGDKVAYIKRSGSRVLVFERTVVTVSNGSVSLDAPKLMRRTVNPKNLVRL